MEELVVLVDDNGHKIGTAKKSEIHNARTPLHLAFSCYIFNSRGQFLLTRRALSKRVWPGWWTNSVCGHLMPGETTEQALRRRVAYEVGIDKLDSLSCILPNYRYTTPPDHGIIENEVCPVYVAVTKAEPSPNPDEVEDFEWLEWPKALKLVEADPGKYSWWMKDQIKLLKKSPQFKQFLNRF